MLLLAIMLAFGTPGAPSGPQLRDPLHVSPEMATFFDTAVDRRSTPLRRVEGLLSVIFDEEGLNFTYNSQTRTAEEVFHLRSGNCLSFTNLVIAAGRHLGLDVRFREVQVAPSWSRHGRLVVYNQHVNAVVLAGADVYVVDLLPQVNRIELGGMAVSDDRGLAHFYNNVGADLFAAGSVVAAIQSFRRALDSDRTAAFAWTNLGVALVAVGELEEAEEAYEEALRWDRNNMVTLTNLAELYEKAGRQREAEKMRAKVEDFRKRNPYYHYSLGLAAFNSGLFEQSITHFRSALKRKGKEPNFHHALARAYVQAGRLAEAIKELEKAAKFAPTEAGRQRYSEKLELLAESRP